jgi:hypothetical protein
MFNNSQAAADVLKGMVGRGNKRALEAIQRLEQCGWHSRAFADACQQTGTQLNENGFSFSVDVGHSVERLINRYLALMGCDESDPFDGIFDPREAADYLGLSYNTFRQYASRDNRITGKKVGQTMIYARQQLDAFKRTMKASGNPNWVKEEE